MIWITENNFRTLASQHILKGERDACRIFVAGFFCACAITIRGSAFPGKSFDLLPLGVCCNGNCWAVLYFPALHIIYSVMQHTEKNRRGAKHSTSPAERQYASHRDALSKADIDFNPEYCKKVIEHDGIDPVEYRIVVLFRLIRNIALDLDKSKENTHLVRVQENLFNSTFKHLK